ncbi:MAG: FAD-dependent oxidoreductase [Panacagrimonas sp.]
MSDAFDVAVVGAGVVGLAAAVGLREAGFSVCLIERAKALPGYDANAYDPRVYAIAPSAARFLQTLKVWDEIAATRACACHAMQVWSRNPAQGLNFTSDALDQSPLNWIVEHRLLVHALSRHLNGVEQRFGHSVEALSLSDEGASLKLSDHQTVNAELIVCAQGGDASLREMAGLDVVGWEYGQTAVVCHLHTQQPHDGKALQRFVDGSVLAFLPLADGRRSIVWSLPDAEAQGIKALSDQAFLLRLRVAIQDQLGELSSPTRRLSFALRLQHAPRYVTDRFALIGDSAHVVHPLAGQGLNLGLADAQCLINQVALARSMMRQWWAVRTLSRFERTRRAANLEMAAVTDLLGRTFASDHGVVRNAARLGMYFAGQSSPLKRSLQRAAQYRN